MSRISTICTLSGILMVLALSANVASAGSVTVHTTTPTVHPTVTPFAAGKHISTGKITVRKAGGGSAYDDKTKTNYGDIKGDVTQTPTEWKWTE